MMNKFEETAERREAAIKAMRDHLACFVAKDMNGWIELFVDEAVIEFPFAPEGFPARLEGKQAI